jgi:predicted esterase
MKAKINRRSSALLHLRLIAGLLVLLCQKGFAQANPPDSIIKRSYIYASKDSTQLGLDAYSKASTSGSAGKPCVIFVFGGAFIGGHRDDSIYRRYLYTLAAHDYIVLSISYRLGLRNVTHLSRFSTAPLRKAIDMAVEDTYDATRWAIDHAVLLGIDPTKIILCGSSSGAITVLESDFYQRNHQAIANRLPATFGYAGIIAFSGAILTYDGSLKYRSAPAPTLLFHGTADKIVPYNRIRFFNKGFYGSSSIANTFRKNNYPFFIYREKDLGHETAVLPMYRNIPDILDFLDKFVIRRQQLQIDLLYTDLQAKPMITGTAKELFKKLQSP